MLRFPILMKAPGGKIFGISTTSAGQFGVIAVIGERAALVAEFPSKQDAYRAQRLFSAAVSLPIVELDRIDLIRASPGRRISEDSVVVSVDDENPELYEVSVRLPERTMIFALMETMAAASDLKSIL